MLLPSDVARLVLGYLQQEKLTSTCRAFVAESPHLKEYAEHHTDDGAIPGCLLSLFGKNLTAILNEYTTMKAKENEANVPFMMSSLWKKLDLTLSQIRCMQESAAFQTNQRARTRQAINERMRQKMLTSTVAVSGSPVSHPVAQQISTPVLATQYILCPITTPGTSQTVSSMSIDGQSVMQNSNPTTSSIVQTQTVSVTSTQKKLSSTATSSPMRRKPDNQRRRRIVAPVSGSAAERDVATESDTIQGLIDNDFPQLVIENAREKILSNKCLQEKLAENINKILASDSAAQTSKQSDSTAAEQDASIDEILGLQGGEMHMSEEAIHDILVQTELDPDFQELYDLFACVSSKAPKSNPRDPSSSQNVETKTSEKSKKQDGVEDANSRERAGNKMDGCLRERKTDNVAVNDQECDTRTCLTEKADEDSNNLQEMCVDEAITSGSPKIHRHSSDLPNPIENTVMESSKEPHRTALEPSYTQPQDVQMECISQTNESTDDCCFIVEDVLPQVSVSPEKTGPKSMCLKGSENEEPSEMPPSEGRTNKKLSDKSQQENNIGSAALQPSELSSQGNVLLISAQALDGSSAHNENDYQPAESSKISSLNKLGDDAKHNQGNENFSGATIEKDGDSQVSAVNVAPITFHGQDSLGPGMEPYSSAISVPSSSQAAVDPSTIVTLNIITEDLPEEAELHNAVKSIHEESYPTIILSPLVKGPESKRVGPSQSSSGEFMESSVFGGQSQLLTTSSDNLINTINIPNGDCTVYAVSGTSTNSDGSVIQLMPTSGSTFAPTNNLFISSCVASNVPAKQPNIMMLSNSSAPNTSQKQAGLFQTPPRPGSMYTVGQAISPKLSQGSTIILASPVQPVLQGVMSMFPVSLVGQSGGTFTAQPHQILHVPVSKPMVPKLPLPPKSQKPLPKPAANTGKPLSNPATDSMSRPSSLIQRENEEKNSEAEIRQKSDERSVPETLNAKSVEAHRRVLCFDGTSASLTSNSSSTSSVKSQKKDKNDTIQNTLSSTEAESSHVNMSKDSRKTEGSASSMGKSSRMDTTAVQTKDQPGEKRPTSSAGGYGINKENVLQVEPQIHSAAQIEKKTTSQDHLRPEKNGKPPREPVKKQTSLPNILRRTPQKMSLERICSTSPLAKQASQFLQDMHFHSPNTKSRSIGDVPRTPGSGLEDKLVDNCDHTRTTPTCRRYSEDGGTPKPMMPPATPDLPTCSPASEAGSENSVNMAAHTLMILSRASVAKASSSTPLKDNTHQSKPSKSTSKKRKLEDSDEYERRSHRKDLLSPSSLQKKKKMKKNRKKSTDNFPAGMDVEKFLMSLHYDE